MYNQASPEKITDNIKNNNPNSQPGSIICPTIKSMIGNIIEKKTNIILSVI